jgi:hypothetical protein
MKFIGVTLFSGLLMAVAAAPLHGDEVDDLFAGKPVITQDARSLVQPFGSPTLDQGVVSPLESAKLADETAWEASIKQAPKTKSSAQSPKPVRESQAPSEVSLVPEPSAIALGVGAILYFLIFFRRRHLP